MAKAGLAEVVINSLAQGRSFMPEPADGVNTVRFGVFEADLRARQLHKAGMRVRVQQQPFQILEMLLIRPGAVVTREELRAQLWPADTFVDFEHSLNSAIKKLRDALGDDANNPRFIETLPRLGYRFIAPVTSNDRKELAAPGPVVAVRRKVLVTTLTFVCVAAAIAVAVFYFGSGRRARIGSVAVLPFANASGDPSMEYLSDGITEGVIDRLSGLPNLKVISRTSAFRYKQRDFKPQQVAKDLGVDALVTGRVVQRGDDLSVNAELVDAREDKQLWGEQYNRKFADIVSIQQEIATAISGNLRVRLASEEKTRLNKSSATNPEAYQLYLKGRFHANQATAAGLTKSIEYFQHAIDRDPGFALAYAGLADSYNALGGWWIYLAPAESLPKAKAAAMKALELDDMLAEAHAALATAELFYDWNWSSAESEFRRAIELNPNSAISHAQYCGCLLMRARFDESLAECQRAQELDPLSPGTASQLGYVHLVTRRYNESIAQFQKALELYPNAAGIRAVLAWAYAMMGMYPQALAEYDKIADQDKTVAPENQLVADGLGWVYAVAGRKSEALRIAQQVKELSSHAYVDSYQFATIYAGLRDKDEVFRLLEKGYKERSAAMSWLAVDPFWESVRSDPRYADLLRRIGLPQR